MHQRAPLHLAVAKYISLEGWLEISLQGMENNFKVLPLLRRKSPVMFVYVTAFTAITLHKVAALGHKQTGNIIFNKTKTQLPMNRNAADLP